jgi:hypothetical protein
MSFHRVVGFVALAFGIVGLAGCAAGAYGVWLAWSRLDRVNDRVFDAIDRGLGVVQDRVPVVRQRVRDAKVTTAEITEAVRTRTAKKVQDHVVTQLEVERRIETLSGRLQAADLRLDASTDAVLDVRELIELGESLGAAVNPASSDELLELLASLRGTVQEAERAVEEIRRFVAPGPEESFGDRSARVAKTLARILLTLSDVDRRLDDFAARLSEVRTGARRSQARTSRYILWGSVVCYGLLTWVAAGQAALSRCGWRRRRRGRFAAGQSAERPPSIGAPAPGGIVESPPRPEACP